MDYVSKHNALNDNATSGQGMSEKHRLGLNQMGQATVEYVLLTVLAVAVVLGGIYQFNSAFQVWANAYFGDEGYLACLLETGELPSLGGEGGECQQAFREFRLEDGEVGLPDGFGGGSGASAEEGSGAGDGSGGGGGRGAFSASEGGFGGIGRAGRGGTRIPLRQGSQGGFGEGGDGSGQNMGGSLTTGLAYDTDSGGRVVRIPLRDRGLYARGVRARPEQEGQATRQRVEREDRGGARQEGPQLMRVPERSLAQVEEFEADGFNFGFFLRYLIIIAIIIAIVVFVGSQIHQASKNL